MPAAHLERLLDELGERASAEIAQVSADGDSAASELLLAAKRRVAARREIALEACETEYARRRVAAAADASNAARRDLLRAQHALVALVIERARRILVERFEREADATPLKARIAELQSFAPGGVVSRANGLRLAANEGRIVIDDSIDTWLEGERAQIAIDLCRAVEAP